MAKYKIVGIPKSLPKAQLGLFKKKKKEPQEPMNNTVWSGVTPEIIPPGQDPFSLPTMSPTPVAEIKLPDYTPEQIDDYRIRKEAQDRKLEKINAYAPKELTYKELSRPKGSFVPGEDMTDELLTELKNSGYYPKKTPEGDYEIFSSKDIADLIYKKGFNPNELSTKLDLGDATELKTYFDPIYQNALMIHAKRNKEKIDYLIKTGLTKTQAINQLVEEGEGTKSGLTKLYGDYTEKAYKAREAEAKKLLAAGATNPNNLTNYQKQNLLNIDAWVQEERDKQTGKDYIVLEDGSKILSPYAVHPNSILPSESTAIRNKVGAWTTDPATGKKQWTSPNNNTAAEEAKSQEFLHKQAIDNFNRTTALQAQAAKAILLEKNLTDEQRKKFLEDPKEFQKIYESYVNWIYAPEGSTTGYIQASGLPGQNQLKSDFNITAEGPKWSAGTNRKNAASGAVDMLDKEWIMGVAGGLSAKPIMGAVSSALSYAPIASAPWLTAGNALNAYFGYEAVRPGGNISKSVDAFSEGNIREGAVEAGWGALGLLPFVKPTVQGAQILKQLKTPGSIQVLPKSGNYSFLYKSPAEGGLLVGNPNLNGSEQVLTGVTEAFNKFSRAAGTSFGGLGLGEFKIMKQTPTSYGYASTVAEGMTLGDMATVGQTVKATTPALAPSLLELKTSDFDIDKLVGNFRIPTQGSASMEPLTNQSILQKYTSDPNVQGISSGDDLWGKTVGPRRKTTQSYNTKGKEAKKAFNEDLLADEDYIAFKNRAQPDPSIESFGVPRASEDWKKFLTPTEDLPDALGISVPLKDLNAEKELILTDQLDLQKRFEDELIDFDEYVKKNDELTNKLNTVDEKLNAQKIENIEALSDNEIAANVINDMRENKIELWQTEEGQKRLQAMIDNTPSLEGHTPDTLIEGMASMNNLNNYYATQLAKRNELLNDMTIVDKMYDNGQMSKSDYFDTQVKLDEELSIVDNNISELNNNIKYKAFYGSVNNEVGIQPGVYSKDELPKVTAHELGHFLGSYAKRKPGTTYLDEELKGLDLKRLEIPFSESSEGDKAHNLFGSPKTEYVNEALRYFNKGSEGTERVPFLAEVRQDMLDKGLIKTEFDPITPDLLKKHYKQYKETKGEKYPLRMYDIIKDKPKNFNIMSSVLNKLPMIVGAGLMIDGLTNNDNNNSNIEQAGLGLLGTFLLRNPKLVKTLPKAFQEKAMASTLANEIAKAELIIPKVKPPLNLTKIDPIARSTVGKKSDILGLLGSEQYDEFLKYLYSQKRQAYDSPLIEFKSTKPTSYFSKDISLPYPADMQPVLFKEKYCLEGSECAKTSNAVTNRVFTDITGKEFEVEQNAHNAWHLEDQMTRHGGMNISPLLQQHGIDLLKVGDRILMGNNVNQSTHVPGYTADPEVRHAGFFAGYFPTKYGDIPMLFESGSGNPMFMNPIYETFSGSNSIKQVIRPKQFLDDEFGLSLVDKNIRYAYRDKPSVAVYSSDVPEVQKLIEEAENVRGTIKKEYDITNDEFDELLVSLIGIGAQETKLGAKLPGSKMSKAKIKTQDFLETVGLTQPIKRTLNAYKNVVNKVTSKASDLPPYPGTSYIEMESAKLAAESNIPFDDALQIVQSKYKPKPKKTISTVEPSKGIFRQKYQTKTADLSGFDDIKEDEVANGIAQMAENYNKIKKAYPDADPRKVIDLTILMWNSPGKAQNKELVEFYLFGKGNPDPNTFKFDYIDKVKKFRDELINVQPQLVEDFFETTRKSRPEIQYKKGGQTINNDDYIEMLIDENSIESLINQGYIIEEL